jgi:hypothetical protein
MTCLSRHRGETETAATRSQPRRRKGVRRHRHAPPASPPGERDPVPTIQEAGWASGPVWTGRKISPPQGFDPRTVQPVAIHFTTLSQPPILIRYDPFIIEWRDTNFDIPLPAVQILLIVPVFVFFNGIPTHKAAGEAKDIFDCRHKDILFR